MVWPLVGVTEMSATSVPSAVASRNLMVPEVKPEALPAVSPVA